MRLKRVAQIILACVFMPFFFFAVISLGNFVFTGHEIQDMQPRMFVCFVVCSVSGLFFAMASDVLN